MCTTTALTLPPNGYILRIVCNKAEKELKTTAWTDHVLNAIAIDNPLEYARFYLIVLSTNSYIKIPSIVINFTHRLKI